MIFLKNVQQIVLLAKYPGDGTDTAKPAFLVGELLEHVDVAPTLIILREVVMGVTDL